MKATSRFGLYLMVFITMIASCETRDHIRHIEARLGVRP